MTYSSEWEQIYQNNLQISTWPWPDLIHYAILYAKPKPDKKYKVLELGCGEGNNISILQSLGYDYYGIDNCDTAIETTLKKFPELKDKIVKGDFTKDIPISGKFDLIIDKGSMTHNDTESIKNCLKIIDRLISHRGKFIGLDWLSTKSTSYNMGIENSDKYTRNNLGQWFPGNVHFTDKMHLYDLFKNYEIEYLEHKETTREIPKDSFIWASWNFVAIKI